jgi:5-methylcytosine-specific restriction endonuclease McrA
MARPGRNDREWRALCKRLKATLPPICWLCGEEIDLSLSGRHPWGWTLDHVVPLSQAPHLANVESNLRPAHRRHNEQRGTGTYGQVKYSRKWG